MVDTKTTIAPWKIIAELWNTWFTSPSRVSEDEAKKYRGWLSKIKKKKALVLGVTPEIREPLAEFGFETTCIDINPEMVKAMDSVLNVKNPNEKIVIENWLNSTLKDNEYDIVLGDAIFPNVKWEERKKLLSEVARVLKPKGLFITRAFCVPREKRFKNVDEIFEHFSKREANYENALKFTLEIQILFYNPENHEGTFLKSKEILEKLKDKDGFHFESENLNKILEMVWNFWCQKYVDKVYLYAYRDYEEKEYEEFFDIIEVYEANDNEYAKITPMYILKLKD